MSSCCHERNWFDFHRREMRDCPDDELQLVLESSVPRNGQTNVSPSIKSIKLTFRHGFNWVDSYEIDMWQGSNKVPIRVKASHEYGFKILKVIPVNSLEGGVVYKVRIKAFFVDHCGDTIIKIKMISFRTGCK
ncbi:MAG: Ig-like domain-containing protein [Syntrophomonadaceae bacterium]|nr:Ig-like domain-containing protein [Syntrophomonadaceae bacterium]MDD3022872.1 Ig-like domain-containing protein [Syntrophomonadaceae bacterium]